MKSSQGLQLPGEDRPPVSSTKGVSSAFSSLSALPWFEVRSRLEGAFTFESWRSASPIGSGCCTHPKGRMFLLEGSPSSDCGAPWSDVTSEVSGGPMESTATRSTACSEVTRDGVLLKLFDSNSPPVEVDGEGRYIPATCGVILLLSSFLILPLNPYMAFASGCDILGGVSLLVCCCSVLHWALPRWGWRRRLDVAVARLASVCFLTTALTSAPGPIAALYPAAVCAVLAFNHLGWQFSSRGEHLKGTFCHLALHAVGTAANAVLVKSIELGAP